MSNKVQRFCFTLNNYTDDEYKAICDWLAAESTYSIVGKEVGECGTPHLQGYCNLGRQKRLRFNQIKAKMPRSHIEIARGTDEENQTYCKKGGDYVEYGVIQYSGKRNDLQPVVEAIVGGKRIAEVALEYPIQYVKFSRGLRDLAAITARQHQRSTKTEVWVLTGAPGTGKSRFCFEQATAVGDTYYKPRGDWWDGYEGQKSVIIDDFYGWIKYDEMLKICDRYPYQVPVKGGYQPFTSERIYITSNAPVERWYKFDNYNPAALLRRIEHLHVDEIPTPTESENNNIPYDLFNGDTGEINTEDNDFDLIAFIESINDS